MSKVNKIINKAQPDFLKNIVEALDTKIILIAMNKFSS